NTILDEIDAGFPNGDRYSDNNAATTRAAWKVVLKHMPSLTEKACRSIIKKWTKNGVLVSREYHNSARREPTSGLFVNPAKRPGRSRRTNTTRSGAFGQRGARATDLGPKENPLGQMVPERFSPARTRSGGRSGTHPNQTPHPRHHECTDAPRKPAAPRRARPS